MSLLSKIRKVLGVITDVLLIGRGKGWWSERHQPNVAESFRDELHRRD